MLCTLNQSPAKAQFAVWAANVHYPPAGGYKPFLWMAVRCYKGSLCGWLFPAWHRWWMATVVARNMFPSYLKEPRAHGAVACFLKCVLRIAHSLGTMALVFNTTVLKRAINGDASIRSWIENEEKYWNIQLTVRPGRKFHYFSGLIDLWM